jgi:ubiquinone/menaquinone biosynthesis C-methylase UbiE
MGNEPALGSGGVHPGHGPDRLDPTSRADIQARVVGRFESAASFWSDIYRGQDVFSIVHQRRREIALAWADAVGLRNGARALEIGCGAGLTAVALAQRGLVVEATDSAPGMLLLARRHADEAGVEDRVHLDMADAHSLPFEDGSFDLAIALGVVPWLHSPGAALRELARVVRPGAHVIVNSDNRHRAITMLDPMLSPALAPLRRAAKSALARIGVVGASTVASPPFMHSLAEFDRLLSEARLQPVATSTVGFGPFTFARRKALPERVGIPLDRRLQALADRAVPILRSAGAQYLVLARRPVVP